MSTTPGRLPLKIPTTLTLTLTAATFLLPSGCQKQEDPNAQASVRLLQDIKTAVSATHRPGEAFVVLKSDAVIYMADMPVYCLCADFKGQFDQFQAEWRTARAACSAEAAAKDPAFASRLKDVDAKIAEATTRRESAAEGTDTVVGHAIIQLGADLKSQQAKQQANETAYREYAALTKALDQTLARVRANLASIKSEGQKLVDATVAAINDVILADRLPIPKLSKFEPDKFFVLEMGETFERDGYHDPNPRIFVKSEPDTYIHGIRGRRFVYHVGSHIPEGLTGTKAEKEIRTAFGEWERLESVRLAAEKEATEAEAARAEALIPWSNRWEISANAIPSFMAGRADTNQAFQELSAKLADLKAGGPGAKALIAEEVHNRQEAADRSLFDLRQQREDMIDATTKVVLEQTKRAFGGKFATLVATQTKGMVRTGSRGDFSIPAAIAYLFAERHRDNGESLIWLTPVDPQATRVQLSNSNTASAGKDGDEFWMLDYRLP